MREKLVFILRNPLLTLDDRTDQILSLLIEEIKKELLTDEEQYALWQKYELEHPLQDINWEQVLIEAQLQKIIKKVEEK